MDIPSRNGLHLMDTSRQVGHRLFIIFENRLQLLLLEVQEEREKILRAGWLALGAAVLGMLAGMTLTVAIVLAWSGPSRIVLLAVLGSVYALAATFLCLKLFRLQQDWQTLAGTIEQLEKDRECLKKNQG